MACVALRDVYRKHKRDGALSCSKITVRKKTVSHTAGTHVISPAVLTYQVSELQFRLPELSRAPHPIPPLECPHCKHLSSPLPP